MRKFMNTHPNARRYIAFFIIMASMVLSYIVSPIVQARRGVAVLGGEGFIIPMAVYIALHIYTPRMYGEKHEDKLIAYLESSGALSGGNKLRKKTKRGA